MRKAIILLLGVLVFGLAVLVIKEEKSSNQVQNTNKYKTETNSEGQVTVKVTPINLSSDKVQFKTSLDTHSISLDKNLKEISILIDDKGNEYKPISWDGGTGGHHLEGSLIFPKLEEGTKSVKLIIKGIGADRIFLWTLLKGS